MLWLTPGVRAGAGDYYVSMEGSDANPGTEAAPFRTLQQAANIMHTGQKCVVRAGVYRESVKLIKGGVEGYPLVFEASPREKVVVDGTEPIGAAAWTKHAEGIYKTPYAEPVEQLFVDGRMMVEARWPNARFDQMLDPGCWQPTGIGSRYGKIVDPALAESGIDWTGALAVLNVAHQFFSWTREVAGHEKGSDTLVYDKNLPGITRYADLTKEWEDDKYYLVGKLDALDAPSEWFYDREAQMLYLYPPDGKNPADREIAIKKRDYGFLVRNCDYVILSGLEFFGCTFRFEGCNHCLVENCRVEFPSYSRRITEFDPDPCPVPGSFMSGENNTVRRTAIAHTPAEGLKMLGRNAAVENCIIHDVDWFGNIFYTALRLGGNLDVSESGNPRAVSNTLFDAGNTILAFEGKGRFDIGYNHVYNGGMLCKDVSLIYTQWPHHEGSAIHHNWVHGCRPLNPKGGLGIRADDQSLGLSVHHNVVWDCGRDGIILKGDRHEVYHNTVFEIGGYQGFVGNYINLNSEPEREKPWRFQYPFIPQHLNSLAINNAAITITERNGGRPYSLKGNLVANYRGELLGLQDAAAFDFRPRKDSPLVDGGVNIPGFIQDFVGAAPDIGAYEYGKEPWKAGADWKD